MHLGIQKSVRQYQLQILFENLKIRPTFHKLRGGFRGGGGARPPLFPKKYYTFMFSLRSPKVTLSLPRPPFQKSWIRYWEQYLCELSIKGQYIPVILRPSSVSLLKHNLALWSLVSSVRFWHCFSHVSKNWRNSSTSHCKKSVIMSS